MWIMPDPAPVFHCSKCRAEHVSPGRGELNGVWKFPETLDTKRDRPDTGYYTFCAGGCK